MTLLENTITPKKAAELLGVSIQFIRMRLRDGRLPHYKVGSRYMVTREDTLALIERPKPLNAKHAELE